MKRQTTVRLEDADLSVIDAEARDAGMNRADYIRTVIMRRATQNNVADAQMEARLSRMEKLLMASAISSFEAQLIARGNLTKERQASAVRVAGEQIKEWQARGFLLAGDLDPNTMLTKKESPNE